MTIAAENSPTGSVTFLCLFLDYFLDEFFFFVFLAKKAYKGRREVHVLVNTYLI